MNLVKPYTLKHGKREPVAYGTYYMILRHLRAILISSGTSSFQQDKFVDSHL